MIAQEAAVRLLHLGKQAVIHEGVRCIRIRPVPDIDMDKLRTQADHAGHPLQQLKVEHVAKACVVAGMLIEGNGPLAAPHARRIKQGDAVGFLLISRACAPAHVDGGVAAHGVIAHFAGERPGLIAHLKNALAVNLFNARHSLEIDIGIDLFKGVVCAVRFVAADHRDIKAHRLNGIVFLVKGQLVRQRPVVDVGKRHFFNRLALLLRLRRFLRLGGLLRAARQQQAQGRQACAGLPSFHLPVFPLPKVGFERAARASSHPARRMNRPVS